MTDPTRRRFTQSAALGVAGTLVGTLAGTPARAQPAGVMPV